MIPCSSEGGGAKVVNGEILFLVVSANVSEAMEVGFYAETRSVARSNQTKQQIRKPSFEMYTLGIERKTQPCTNKDTKELPI